MRILSLNVGLPREVTWKNQQVTTGIFKEPVEHRVFMRTMNLDGDRQADLTVHGGRHKAIYAYPSEHYAYWKEQLPGMKLPWGMFGENFTTEGMLETDVYIGDRFRIGEAGEVVVTQPRMPCYKLGLKFQRDDILKMFLESGRCGFYFAVVKEGMVGTQDRIELIQSDKDRIPVADIAYQYIHKDDPDLMQRASQHPALPEGWRNFFHRELQKHNG